MSAIDSLSTTSALDGTGSTVDPASKANGFSALDSESFIKIIFTELSKQDPLKPSDTNTLLQQLSSLRNIQSDIDMSDKLKNLVGQNELSSAAGLIGRSISGISDTNERVEGPVLSISKTSDGAVLNLADGVKVSMHNVDEILPDPTKETK